MEYILGSNNNQTTYNIKRLIFDNKPDFLSFTDPVAPGSTAFIIEDSETYMLNTQYTWVLINIGGGGGGGTEAYWEPMNGSGSEGTTAYWDPMS